MIDFKKSNLFDRERKKFEKFKNTKLFTPDEYASRIETTDDTMNNVSIVDTESYLGGSAVDLFGGDGEDMWSSFGDDDNGSDRKRHVDISNERLHETGVWWKDIVYAPFFLVVYVFKSLIYDFPTKEEWVSIFKGVQKVSIVTAIVSLLLWVLNFNFIFSLMFQTIAATLMLGLSISMQKALGGKEDSENSATEGGDASFDMFGGGGDAMGGDMFGGGGDMFGGGADMFGGLGTDDQALDLDGSNLSIAPSVSSTGGGFNFDSLLNPVNSNELVEEVDVGQYKVLKASPIIVDSTEEFERTLMQVYMENEKYRGVSVPDRKELIESLHGYVVTNDKAFGSWHIAQPHSTEYNNVAYALFKGLGQIATAFLNDEEVMIVRSIKSNPLLYKIEVELPNYFKAAQMQSKIKEIEDALRDGESDNNVQVFIAYYQGIFVFKFLRLGNNKLISLGDILRFYDEDKGETALEAYADDKMGLPILLGLKNNEYPYIVDLEANTSGVIIGGSGSGKSWTTFLALFSLVLTNDYNNCQFVVFDKKNAAFWNQFAKFPHVLGYQTDTERYLECMRELYAEVDRRKALLVSLNEENLKGYRERLRRDKQYDKLKEVPNLIIVVDEITSTMQELETYYLDRDEIQYYKEYRSILAKISQEGRSLGVRLLCIGQRSIDNSVPKNVIANSSFKFAMKMDAESDFGIMMGKEVESMPKPMAMGLGLVKTMSEGGIHPIKTLTVGGANEYQILRLIRVLAFEWLRRADGRDDILNMPSTMDIPKCYNRAKFVQESLQEVSEWRILSPSEETPYKPNGSFGSPMLEQPMYETQAPIEELTLPPMELDELDDLDEYDLMDDVSEASTDTDFSANTSLDMFAELESDFELIDDENIVTEAHSPKNIFDTLPSFTEEQAHVEQPPNEDMPTQFSINDFDFNFESEENGVKDEGVLVEIPPLFPDSVDISEIPTIEWESSTPIFNDSLAEEFIGFDMFTQDVPEKPKPVPVTFPMETTEDATIISETPTEGVSAEQEEAPEPMGDFDDNYHAEYPSESTDSERKKTHITLEDFTKLNQEPNVSNANLKVSRVKIYGYILRYGEKINANDGVVKSRIHRDAILDSFSEVEVSDAQNHTHIICEGDYLIAWKK